MNSSSFPAADCHVHIVGNGSGSTGCWLKLDSPWRRLQAWFLCRAIGLPASALKRDFDRLYIEHLRAKLRASSLGAAVILAHDQVYAGNGRLIPGAGVFHVPNAYVLELARAHHEFLPAVSIHPARPDALEELERCVAGGAAMMKILPNVQNIDCSDRRLTRFWERMAEASLPLLCHTGSEQTLPVINAQLAHPRRLELALQIGVKVIAAHCATRSALFVRDWFDQFVELTRRYPNLYGDNSAFCVPSNRIRGRTVPHCLEPPLALRIVHGSDWPVPVSGLWPWLKGYVDRPTYRRWEQHPNLLERDYQLKRAMGFAPDTFTRVWDLIPPAVRQARSQLSPAPG